MSDVREDGGDFSVHERALWDVLCRHGSAAFAFFDTDLRYRHVSHALAELYRRPVEEHIGRRPSEVLAGALGVEVEKTLQHVLTVGEAHADGDFKAELPDWDGPRHHETRWVPVMDQGRLVGVMLSVIDVTEQRQHAELLRSTQWRTARLQMMTAQLAGALKVEDVMKTVSALSRGIGAERAEVRLLEGEGTPLAWPKVPGPRAPRRVRRLPDSWPRMLAVAVQDRTPLYFSSREELEERLPNRRAMDEPMAQDEHAWVVLPLLGPGAPLGGLRLVFSAERYFDLDDRVFLEALAGQCALAIERARLYEREHRTATSLQRSLLPAELPAIPGVEVAFRYLPGAADVEIGGDWYDTFRLPGERVAMVVGDVIGKGLTAAAGMGRVRNALRALAFTDPEPVAVLSGLDRLFEATEQEESLTTLLYAVVTPATGELVLAEAGHLPVLIVSAEGEARFADAGPPSTPLGVSEPRRQATLQLQQGDVIIGFSDGLVENHTRSFQDGLDLMLTVADGHTGGLDPLLDHLVERLLADQERDDDVTVLGVRVASALAHAPSQTGDSAQQA